MRKRSAPFINDTEQDQQGGDLRALLEEREQAALLHDLIESSPDGIVAADMSGRIRLFNKGAERILGYAQKEALFGLDVRQLYLSNTAQEIVKRMRSEEYGGKGKLSRQEFIAVTKQGAHIPISLTGGIIQDSSGCEVATFGIFRDLRKLREMQDRLVQSEKMAGLGRLAAGVAHEINNPLSGIMLYANLVAEQIEKNLPCLDDLNVIIREAERCKRIVGQLLDFSLPSSQESIKVNLNSLLEETVAIVGKQPLFLEVNIELSLEPQLSSILADPDRLGQVFTNILVNAAQAMQGRGRIKVITRSRAKGNLVEVVIEDTGPGIPEEILQRIFEPFFTTRVEQGGTGLGLSVCYAIVRENRGTIRVSSDPGKGASFSIRFPAIELE
jgi:two-component system NtrC family sensor kinase